MHLTAQIKLKANNRDKSLLDTALRRWHHAYAAAIDRAKKRQSELLATIILWTSKDGNRKKLVVDKKRLHALVLELVTPYETDLHSSCTMSLVVAVEEQIGGWLGLYAEWANAGRKTPKPGFPTLPPGSAKEETARWEAALAGSDRVVTLEHENLWRAEVAKASHSRRLPFYFGAASSGMKGMQAHCGFLRREDGRYFALLTLFGSGDPLGAPVARARNRTRHGTLMNVADTWKRQLASHARAAKKAEKAGDALPPPPNPGDWQPDLFAPTERATASILCPVEMHKGHERLFFDRAVPKSAELIEKEGEYYLHAAFEFPEAEARPLTGNVLVIRRGIDTLISAVLMAPNGRVLSVHRVEGRDLKTLVGHAARVRAIRQQKGQPTKGDKRVSRVTKHYLYSAGHQIIDLAVKNAAEIVLLKDPGARRPQRLLAYKHFHMLAQVLLQLAREAGLPAPEERKIYASWATCPRCGWKPGDPVRVENPEEGQCGGCGSMRDPEYHLPELLGLDLLRCRAAKDRKRGEKLPPFKTFLETLVR